MCWNDFFWCCYVLFHTESENTFCAVSLFVSTFPWVSLMTCKGGNIVAQHLSDWENKDVLCIKGTPCVRWRNRYSLTYTLFMCYVLQLANIICHQCPLCHSVMAVTIAKHCARFSPWARPRNTTLSPLLPFTLLPSLYTPLCQHSGRISPAL